MNEDKLIKILNARIQDTSIQRNSLDSTSSMYNYYDGMVAGYQVVLTLLRLFKSNFIS